MFFSDAVSCGSIFVDLLDCMQIICGCRVVPLSGDIGHVTEA